LKTDNENHLVFFWENVKGSIPRREKKLWRAKSLSSSIRSSRLPKTNQKLLAKQPPKKEKRLVKRLHVGAINETLKTNTATALGGEGLRGG